MRKIELEELKSIQAEILEQFKCICEQYNLRYFMAAGTLLGAVRHQGFIPWDDDVDVFMLRDDYEQLLSIKNLDMPENYKLIHANNVEHFGLPIALLVDERTYIEEPLLLPELVNRRSGVYIEIFPIDGLPNNKIKRKLHWLHCNFIRQMMYLCLFNEFVLSYKHGATLNLLGRVLTAVGKCFWGYQYFLRRLEQLGKSYTVQESEFVAPIVWECVIINIPRAYIDQISNVEFEGKSYTTFAEAHGYLCMMYGDYMKLPSVENRFGHGMNAWWKA